MIGAHWPALLHLLDETAVPGTQAPRLERALAAAGAVAWECDVASGETCLAAGNAVLPGLNGDPASALFAMVHPEDRDWLRRAVDEAARGQAAYDFEFRLRRPDGRVEWVRDRAQVERDALGRPVRLAGVAQFISAPRRTEAAFIAGSEARADSDAAPAQLHQAEKLAALGQLAGGVAHDFNNVLQAVRSGCGFLRRRANDPAAILRYVGMIEDVTARGISVAQRLLAFARRGDLSAEPVDAAEMIDGLCELFAHTLGAAITVRAEVPADLPLLLADKAQLETVLVNLASNARDAMPTGGTLTLAARAVALHSGGRPEQGAAFFTRTLNAGRYVCVSLTDTGTGMAPDVLARVTEPFFTTKPAGRGTGLGLAMARGFAEQSGGGIGIDTEEGRGTRIDVWLPVAEGATKAAEVRVDAAPGGPGGGGRRILVVDDDEVLRRFIGEHLQHDGYDVVTAADGAAALALLDRGEMIDLVVCDLSMPGMSGVDVIAEIQSRRADVPAILLTGFATQAAQLAAKSLTGAFLLLHKPISEEKLVAHVGMLLERKEGKDVLF